MARKHQPDWLYESLPYVYFVGGLTTIFFVRNVLVFICSLLLISAGLIVLKMRYDYRNQPAESAEETPSKSSKASLVQLRWQASFEVGHEVIDRQHRKLFSLGNQLINALMSKQAKGDIELLLCDLVDELVEHFRCEEEIMANYNAPLSEAHKAIHQALRERLFDLQQRFSQGRVLASELVGFLAYDIVAEHIMKEDLKFAPDCKELVAA